MVVTRKTVRRAMVIPAAVALLSGCYQYLPVELAAVPPQTDVRMELTRVGFAKLPQMPEQSGPDVAGTLVRVDPAQVVLRVPVNVRSGEIVTGTIAQDVVI